MEICLGFQQCFRGSGRRFCFGRGSDVSSEFWTSVVQVEQMNKVDLTRIKTTHWKSRALFFESADQKRTPETTSRL